MTTELSKGVEIVKTLASHLEAITHPSRLEIAEYCLEPRRFTDIIMNLKLNPNSFSFHVKVLKDNNIVQKVERGVYKTTELGRLLLALLDKADSLGVNSD